MFLVLFKLPMSLQSQQFYIAICTANVWNHSCYLVQFCYICKSLLETFNFLSINDKAGSIYNQKAAIWPDIFRLIVRNKVKNVVRSHATDNIYLGKNPTYHPAHERMAAKMSQNCDSLFYWRLMLRTIIKKK